MFGFNRRRQQRALVGRMLAGRQMVRAGQIVCPPGMYAPPGDENCYPINGGYNPSGGAPIGPPAYPLPNGVCGWPAASCKTCNDEFVGGTAVVVAGATVTFNVTTNVPFCLWKVTVPGSIGPFFTINQILVGNQPQFAGNGPMSAELFAPDAAEIKLKGDCVMPAVPIAITVTNTSGLDRTFQIGLFGSAID